MAIVQVPCVRVVLALVFLAAGCRAWNLGGRAEVDVNDEHVKKAAAFAVEAIQTKSLADSGRRLEYVGLQHAAQQVVAGMNFFLKMQLKDAVTGEAEVHDVVVYDQFGKLSLTKDESDRDLREALKGLEEEPPTPEGSNAHRRKSGDQDKQLAHGAGPNHDMPVQSASVESERYFLRLAKLHPDKLTVEVKNSPSVPCGDGIKAGSKVTVNYAGFLRQSNRKFDSSWDRGVPFKFTQGSHQVGPARFRASHLCLSASVLFLSVACFCVLLWLALTTCPPWPVLPLLRSRPPALPPSLPPGYSRLGARPCWCLPG